jgi:hypothetical protein
VRARAYAGLTNACAYAHTRGIQLTWRRGLGTRKNDLTRHFLADARRRISDIANAISDNADAKKKGGIHSGCPQREGKEGSQ